MQNKEIISMCTFYAISPIHAGSGAATSVVDLPIQRERHTQWPHVQASAVKGAMRAHYRKFADEEAGDLINLIFGSDSDNDGTKKMGKEDVPAAVSISDARMLAMPVRSNVAPFVWVTSPMVVKRYIRDMAFLGKTINWNIPEITADEAVVLSGAMNGQIILEDAVAQVINTDADNPLAHITELERLLLVSDEMYDYVVSSCTEVQTQIKIDAGKGTTATGSLRYEELLPADTYLYAIVYFTQKHLNHLQAETVNKHMTEVISGFMQLGGDETLGRGICKINWVKGA
ncbi:MAG: type III-B CRISPR module RAMP protein Cmr4 [Calditrichaeota bacterium]|nr:MAG: type III-B CRISPR module RAMP protein Cmr4 [Calditrichota bacterium]